MRLVKKVSIAILLILIISLGVIYYMNGKKTIEQGDTVRVDYLGTLQNGEVFDTNIVEEAQKAEIYNELRPYEPLEFTVGAGQMIPGFEEAVLGMKEGETKEVTIPAEKAYGEPRQELILKNLDKELKAARYSNITKEQFTEVFGEEPKQGETYNTQNVPWPIKIVEIKGDVIKAESVVEVGHTLQLPGTRWDSVVVAVQDDLVIIKQDPQEGQQVIIPFQGRTLPGVVKNVKDNTYDLDLNHDLAGKDLNFKITIKNVEKTT